MKFRGALFAIALGVAMTPHVASAEGTGDALAEALFEQARADMRRGAFAEACLKLQESQRIDPSSGTLLNLMVCEEHIGKLATAWLYGRQLVGRLDDGDERKPIAARRVAALALRVPTLVVRMPATAPADTRVVLDGVELGPSSMGIPLPVDPGAHRLVVSLHGREDRVAPIVAQEGAAYEQLVEPSPPSPVRASEPLRPSFAGGPARFAPPVSKASRTLGWAALGTGIGGLVASGVLGLLTLERAQTVRSVCPEKQCEDSSGLQAATEGRLFSVAAVIALAVGGAGTGLGVYYLGRNASPHAPDSARPPSPAGVIVRWAYVF